MKKTNFFKMLLAAAIMTSAAACNNGGSSEEAAVAEKESAVKVKVKQCFDREVEQVEVFTATVQPNIKNNIAPQQPNRIAKIYVEVGGVSKSNWDAMKMAYKISKSTYENLLENTSLVSPIDGVVTARNYDQGDMFNGAVPLFVVEQIRPVKLLVNASEKLFTSIKKGMEVDVKLDVYGDEIFKGKVSLVYPTINPQTRTFPVEIKIENTNGRVRPGMFARATFAYGTANHVVVPDMAIVKLTGAGDRFVYVVENNKVVFKKVELGRRMDTEYEIISGLNSGDNVVVEGHARLTNGAEVEVMQ